MPQRIAALLARHADLFVTNRIEEIADHYRHPLAIYDGDEVRVRRDPAATVSALFNQRIAAWTLGVRRLDWTLIEYGDVRGERIPALVEWILLREDGSEVTRLKMRYYLAERDDKSLVIHMVEYLSDEKSILTAWEGPSISTH